MLTYRKLLDKYNGNMFLAPREEMLEAKASLPIGKLPKTAIREAAEEYMRSKHRSLGYCYQKDGLCEDDHCRCWN